MSWWEAATRPLSEVFCLHRFYVAFLCSRAILLGQISSQSQSQVSSHLQVCSEVCQSHSSQVPGHSRWVSSEISSLSRSPNQVSGLWDTFQIVQWKFKSNHVPVRTSLKLFETNSSLNSHSEVIQFKTSLKCSVWDWLNLSLSCVHTVYILLFFNWSEILPSQNLTVLLNQTSSPLIPSLKVMALIYKPDKLHTCLNLKQNSVVV